MACNNPTGADTPERNPPSTVLVHLGAGIGNIVLATPLLVALHRLGFTVDLMLCADYPQTATLFHGWSVVREVVPGGNLRLRAQSAELLVPAIPPFYWNRFRAFYHRFQGKTVPRPPEAEFYADEQRFYLSFAEKLGFPAGEAPEISLPIGEPLNPHGVTKQTVILAPGCKTGEMAHKRWGFFPELARELTDVAVVGTTDDLLPRQGGRLAFPPHVRMLVDFLTLRETAEILYAAGAVVGNDSGLTLIAAAVGVPTIMIFGPTPHHSLGRFPANVVVQTQPGFSCAPCWFGDRFGACQTRIDCLATLKPETVLQTLTELG